MTGQEPDGPYGFLNVNPFFDWARPAVLKKA